jgi:hypothetical protein
MKYGNVTVSDETEEWAVENHEVCREGDTVLIIILILPLILFLFSVLHLRYVLQQDVDQ